jgi:hypothetical protein
MARKGRSGEYKVGYGKAPEAFRFKKGVSGNPGGRPKGSRNRHPEGRFAETVLGEGYQLIDVKEGNSQTRMGSAKAALRRMKIDAVKGSFRAQKEFVNLMLSVEREERAGREGQIKAVMEYKAGWYEELRQRRAAGVAALPSPPHPDDIHINIRTGEITVRGPVTLEQEKAVDEYFAPMEAAECAISEVSHLLSNEPNYPYRDQLPAELAHALKIMKKVRRAFGAPWCEEPTGNLLNRLPQP